MNNEYEKEREIIRLPNTMSGTIKWEITTQTIVETGQRLGTIDRHGKIQPIYAKRMGTFVSLIKSETYLSKPKENEVIELGYIEYCPHPVVNASGTCMICLHKLNSNEQISTVSVMFSDGKQLKMNKEAAVKLDLENISRQLRDKKLSLILDLDHTLLHAVYSKKAEALVGKVENLFSFYVRNTLGQPVKHYVKLRPGIFSFLNTLRPLYDMHIYTHGTRPYAEEIVKIIDADGKLFRNRIVSRTDTPGCSHKSLQVLFPSCDDSMVVILDDRVDVWKSNSQNVLLIHPYHYFKGFAEVNNASGPSFSIEEDMRNENDKKEDDELEKMKEILINLHGNFFSKGVVTEAKEQLDGKSHDVKVILGQMQHQVLKGCHLIFSGVFQLGSKPPNKQPLWQLAEQYGAKISETIPSNGLYTHLILHPDRVGTKKHQMAMKQNKIFIVTPSWLIESTRQWKKLDESFYSIEKWKIEQKQLKEKHEIRKAIKKLEIEIMECLDFMIGQIEIETDLNTPDQPNISTKSILKQESNLKILKNSKFKKKKEERHVHFSSDTKDIDGKIVKSLNQSISMGQGKTTRSCSFLESLTQSSKKRKRDENHKMKQNENRKSISSKSLSKKITLSSSSSTNPDDLLLKLMAQEEKEEEEKKQEKHKKNNLFQRTFRNSIEKEVIENHEKEIKKQKKQIEIKEIKSHDKKKENEAEEEKENDDDDDDLLNELEDELFTNDEIPSSKQTTFKETASSKSNIQKKSQGFSFAASSSSSLPTKSQANVLISLLHPSNEINSEDEFENEEVQDEMDEDLDACEY